MPKLLATGGPKLGQLTQRRNLQAVLPGLHRWALSFDPLDSGRLRQALGMLSSELQSIGVDELDQLTALSLEELLQRLAPLFARSKDVLQLYGIDVDEVASSLRVEVLDSDENSARLRSYLTVFGGEIAFEHELRDSAGQWRLQAFAQTAGAW